MDRGAWDRAAGLEGAGAGVGGSTAMAMATSPPGLLHGNVAWGAAVNAGAGEGEAGAGAGVGVVVGGGGHPGVEGGTGRAALRPAP